MAHEEIKIMKEAISDMHKFLSKIHEERNLATEQIKTMKKILSDMHDTIKEK